MAADDDQGEPKLIEPLWVTMTLYLTPNAVIQVVAVAIVTFMSLMCLFFASATQLLIGWMLCGAFAALAVFFGIASISRQLHRRRSGAYDSHQHTEPERRPTTAIVVFIVSVYSLFLTIGLHVFHNFFAANRPGGLKYNITLAIAVASSLYMTIHGRTVIRKHFARGARNIAVSPGQMLAVIALALAFGAYFGWIMT
jgi:hypothetical protein